MFETLFIDEIMQHIGFYIINGLNTYPQVYKNINSYQYKNIQGSKVVSEYFVPKGVVWVQILPHILIPIGIFVQIWNRSIIFPKMH